MIAKLPGWVWSGAWVLAFVAGMVNVVGLLGFQHQAVTHLTGNTSLLAAAIAHGDAPAATALALLIGAFVLGAALSGVIIQDATLQLGHRYGVALILVALLLCLAALLLEHSSVLGMYAAAGASGLQNAMASTFSGSVVRTTHVSGMFTDLGIGLGNVVRGMKSNSRRVMLSITVITGFLAGGIAGAWAFDLLAFKSLYIAAAIAAGVAGAYALFRVVKDRRQLSA
jgi:uncharacterized membrane protein YoaK (UPF0700 family)